MINYYSKNMTFKENLHFIMECKGLQIKELSLKSGISENTLKSYLKEASAEPSLSKLILLSRALGVSLDKLCLNESPKTSKTSVELEHIIERLNRFNDKELSLVSMFTQVLDKN